MENMLQTTRQRSNRRSTKECPPEPIVLPFRTQRTVCMLRWRQLSRKFARRCTHARQRKSLWKSRPKRGCDVIHKRCVAAKAYGPSPPSRPQTCRSEIVLSDFLHWKDICRRIEKILQPWVSVLRYRPFPVLFIIRPGKLCVQLTNIQLAEFG